MNNDNNDENESPFGFGIDNQENPWEPEDMPEMDAFDIENNPFLEGILNEMNDEEISIPFEEGEGLEQQFEQDFQDLGSGANLPDFDWGDIGKAIVIQVVVEYISKRVLRRVGVDEYNVGFISGRLSKIASDSYFELVVE